MSTASLIAQIERCATRAGLSAPGPVAPALAAYLELLTRWNRRINLTAYLLEPPSDEAIEHLIIEPLWAAQHVLAADRRAIDVGSGGGSPAFPLALSCPTLRMVLVESKARKAAFLREVIRELSLKNASVVNLRLEDFGEQPDSEPADLVTIRAVRVDQSSLAAIGRVLLPRGRILWFTTQTAVNLDESEFLLESTAALGSENRSLLAILRRRK